MTPFLSKYSLIVSNHPVQPDENAMRMGGASKVFSPLWLYEYYGRTGWEKGNLACN